MSQLSSYFKQNQFFILVEYLSFTSEIFTIKTTFTAYPTVKTFADRVHSDHDIAPLQASAQYLNSVDKLLHFLGKARDIADFEIFLKQAKAANIQNLLLLIGDKLKQYQDGEEGLPHTRYLESFNGVMAAKQHGDFQIGVAFNPFKIV